jgi:hypothetical protein
MAQSQHNALPDAESVDSAQERVREDGPVQVPVGVLEHLLRVRGLGRAEAELRLELVAGSHARPEHGGRDRTALAVVLPQVV